MTSLMISFAPGRPRTKTEDHDFFDGFLCTVEPESPNMFDQPLFYEG